jgi:hypothetical protein
MTRPHERPIPGPAADFAAALAALLPVIETDRPHLRAPRLQDFDAWIHRPVARTEVPARVETERRRMEGAAKASKRGD